jgi:cation transport ATPase
LIEGAKKVNLKFIAAILIVAAIFFSLILYFLNQKDLATSTLKIILFLGLIPVWFEIVRDLFKKKFGVDFIAGIALLGTFFFAEYWAGVIILLMLM